MTPKEARAQAAKATGARESSIRQADTIARADPELAEQVLNGEKTLAEADRERKPTPPPLQSYRYLSAAIAELQKSIDEMGRLRCPEKSRLKDVLRELHDIRNGVSAWAERTCT
jgi:hypothetical protein